MPEATGKERGQGLERQFGNPEGLIGHFVGHAMALEHRALHREVVRRLGIGPDDRVLEIGFGPGTAVRLAALVAQHVSGVDISRAMVSQALRRNREGVLAGRVDLRLGSAEALPYADGSFTAVFEVNSIHHWDDQLQGLREVRRVLRSGGRALFALRRGHDQPLASEVSTIVDLLEASALQVVATEMHGIGHGGAFVMARRV